MIGIVMSQCRFENNGCYREHIKHVNLKTSLLGYLSGNSSDWLLIFLN